LKEKFEPKNKSDAEKIEAEREFTNDLENLPLIREIE
jgi:hypothetical protein